MDCVEEGCEEGPEEAEGAGGEREECVECGGNQEGWVGGRRGRWERWCG